MINVLTRNNNTGLGWGEGYINPPLGPPKPRHYQLPLKSWFWKSQTKLNFEAAFRVYSTRQMRSQKRHSVVNFGCYINWRDPWSTLTI